MTLLSASGSFDDNGCTLDSVDNTTGNIIDEEEANNDIISQVIEEVNDGEASVDNEAMSAAQTQDINTIQEKTFSHSTNANTTPQPIIPTTPNSKRHNIYKATIIIFAISILCIIIGVSVKVSNDKSSSNEQVAISDTNLITTEEETSSTTLLRSTNAPSPITPSFETYAGSTVLVSKEEILESTTNEEEEE